MEDCGGARRRRVNIFTPDDWVTKLMEGDAARLGDRSERDEKKKPWAGFFFFHGVKSLKPFLCQRSDVNQKGSGGNPRGRTKSYRAQWMNHNTPATPSSTSLWTKKNTDRTEETTEESVMVMFVKTVECTRPVGF